MHYTINVSLKGRHFFATADHSCTSREEAVKVYAELNKRFPESDGFKIDITRWETMGRPVEFSKDEIK